MSIGVKIKLGQSIHPDTSLYGVFRRAGQRLQFAKGQPIHFQGDESTGFYMIQRGRLRSYLLAEDGRQVTLEILGAGKLFGQSSYFGRVPRPTSAMAETELEMLAINYERLQPYLTADPALIMEMFDLMGYSIRTLTLQISSMAFLDADKRVAQMLLLLRGDREEKDVIQCTHQELAELACLNRVTVTRALHRFAEKGWVRLCYRGVKLLDPAALRGYLGWAAGEGERE